MRERCLEQREAMGRSRPSSRMRWGIGFALLVLSFVPWLIAVVVPFLGWSAQRVVAAMGGLIVGAEIIGALAVVVLGREAYQSIRARLRLRRSLDLDA